MQQERNAFLELFMKTIQKEVHECRGVTVYLPRLETAFVFGAMVHLDADRWIGARSELGIHPKSSCPAIPIGKGMDVLETGVEPGDDEKQVRVRA